MCLIKIEFQSKKIKKSNILFAYFKALKSFFKKLLIFDLACSSSIGFGEHTINKKYLNSTKIDLVISFCILHRRQSIFLKSQV